MYLVSDICEIVKGRFLQQAGDPVVRYLVYDSRQVQQPDASLFFALRAGRNDGHVFLADAYAQGVRNFIVSHPGSVQGLAGSNIILVDDTLAALQQLAIYHRSRHSIPVIGITGSNGKTIVKEWLYLLLQEDHTIARSPRSFNSQIGVPLSIWQLNSRHDLALFEAGISRPGEMEKLARIIRPSIGLLTNLGEAHSEGFVSDEQKLQEKLKLFEHCPILIARGKDISKRTYKKQGTKLLTWGAGGEEDITVLSVEKQEGHTAVNLLFENAHYHFSLPFADEASIENAISCAAIMLVLGYKEDVIARRMNRLHAIDMRLQLIHSFNECLVINDSYSADINSLRAALDFQQQQGAGLGRTVILSDFFETGRTEASLYTEIRDLLQAYGINRLVLIGEKIRAWLPPLLDDSVKLQAFDNTEAFLGLFRSSGFFREIILIKGARKFGFERIAKLFEEKLHQTVLEINLNALVHNLKQYQRLLKPETRVMAMVKAFSYGSGGAEIASVLQYHHVNYLGVAYADEGADLVRAGIRIPIMVMNAETFSFQSIVDHHLQPVIYSFDLLHAFEDYLAAQGMAAYPIHLEIETGMNRLGFALSEVEALSLHLSASGAFTVQSVFTHLAASEDPEQDGFTREQAARFEEAATVLESKLSYRFLKHIANSAAIVRHPQLQLDMVRLGIGMYGVEIDNDKLLELLPVATLRTTIAQLKHLKKGETVSYNRRGLVQRDSIIATVRIGYADGYSRRFGHGKGHMLVNGALAPVIGTVCMDMTMLDVTDIPGVKLGDEAIVFGPDLPVQELAAWIGTIPYEIMTGVSQRVKRIYFHE
ncbi:MAG TPA: bifunctional UDP-N-acetylmuramoyl-tripeptide:D-alanyl-D-alanine ligase/alanine racemase [Flavisolibacter sp.]|nr:bifunctional UDP-N-acetylmuramoyl-tripeptide:D-alanyl-D-alanine ligase/alanine racemase [Flavisolibacter sp.]